MTMATRTYDPGTPTVPVRMPDGCWSVDSFRGSGSYVVNLAGDASWSCPDFGKRGHERPCKHIRAARAAEWNRSTERAKLVSDAGLNLLLHKYEQDGRLDIALAIRTELLARGLQVTA
jgi:hypothetical protein